MKEKETSKFKDGGFNPGICVGNFTLIELLANTAFFTENLAKFIKVGEMREER